MIFSSAVLGLSAVADRLFYGLWTFPPLKFLYFNLAQSLAVFYGRNDWHYYISQGYPLLLTTALPFTLIGIYRALVKAPSSKLTQLQTTMQAQLASICVIMPAVLSLISHKEVRFIYPLLPSLHILTAPPLVSYFLPAVSQSSRVHTPRRLTLLFLLFANIVIALYTTLYHASGTLSVLSYLRDQHQIHATNQSKNTEIPGITAGFLMPCHSTPWRSHLTYPDIHSWALGCEPPVDLNPAEKAAYVDEADQFYENPAQFLRQNMEGGLRHFPRKPTYASSLYRNTDPAIHNWPDYLIFFEQLEPTLQSLLRPSSYSECWRTYNTAWHDDWRRRGDIVVWCLDPAEQQSWRSESRKRASESHSREKHFDRVIESMKRELSATGKKRTSPFQRWVANVDWSLPRSWPWEKRRSSWRDALRMPGWMKKPKTWQIPSQLSFGGNGKKKNKAQAERELWS